MGTVRRMGILALALAGALGAAAALTWRPAGQRALAAELARLRAENRRLAQAEQRAEAASGAKSRFLATVSHEFRTPLSGILGMADLLAATRLDPEQTAYLSAVQTSGRALLSLIDEVLDFSRIEAGRLDLATAPFEPAALVESVVELLAPRAQAKGIELAAFVGRSVPAILTGDSDRVRQILVNLAGNAVKFTAKGGAGILLDHDGEVLTIAVRDTGPGIAPERLGMIFAEFEQGGATAAERQDGAGLGLPITRRLAEGMGGSIAVESEPGRGSTFAVRLPLAGALGATPMTAPPLLGATVLIVARSPFQAPFIACHVDEAGGTARHVRTVGEARAWLAEARPDILVADCALGFEEARGLAREARERGVPRCIVLLSPFDRRLFGPPLEAGFDGYLVKPVRGRAVVPQLTGSVPPEPLAPTASTPGPARIEPPQRPAVLLAEDNEINALIAMRAIERLGGTVDWARDGQEALALAQSSLTGEKIYDLVLMDLRMPGLDGLEATRRLRASEAALARPGRLRVVALSANGLEQDEEAARAAGLDGFLRKPLDLERLAGLLAEASGLPREAA